MKIFSLIRRQMAPLFARCYLFLARLNSKEPAMSRKIQFACLFLLLAPLSAAAQSVSAPPPPPPLNFGNNFFVTGDYAVGGVSLIGKASSGFATGTISIGGDTNPGVAGTNSVPKGAQVVAALLYWQTIETLGVKPGDPGSGRRGFFRPLFSGGPQTGYSIQGTALPNSNSTVYWDSSGCNIPSSKQLVTYRADVRAALRQDASGDVSANGTYEVRLPTQPNSSGSGSNTSGTPNTIGATLVIIYRVLSPDVPLNSIVIYDGTYAPTTASLTTMQTLQGFYQAGNAPAPATTPISKLTYIVSGGTGSLKETVSLKTVSLPSLYGNQPPFPGWYPGGHWDNPSWIFGPSSAITNPPNPIKSNPVLENDPSATTVVNNVRQGCVATAAIIFSTTVKNTDGDGLLDVWKAPPKSPNNLTGRPGYCDASILEGSCTAGDPSTGWVDLPGAKPNQKDVFVQLDWLCNSLNSNGGCAANPPPPFCSTLNANGSCNTATPYSFDPRLTVDANGTNVVDKVVAAFANSTLNHTPIQLHVIPTNAIQEPPCTDFTDNSTNPATVTLCPYPNQPGVVGWPGGVVFLQNHLIDGNGNLCFATDCGAPVFQPGKRLSYHYALWGHALGLPNWTLQAGTLTSVVQSTNTTVTFTTSTPHGLTGTSYTSCPNATDRVTVAYAITNLNMNGAFCVKISNANTFTITIANSPTTTYTRLTDPSLAVASGQAGTVSGFSDIGGQHSVMTLGSWGPDGRSFNVKAGTFMHELGHSIGLTHFGLRYPNLNAVPGKPDYTPGAEVNCKANYQSAMNYLFQIDLLGPNGALDFSSQELADLNENPLGPSVVKTKDGKEIAFQVTSWYNTQPLFTFGGHSFPSPAAGHCDGTPLNPGDVNQPMFPFLNLGTALKNPVTQKFDTIAPTPAWSPAPSGGLDVNFDGKYDSVFHGHNDWISTSTSPGINLLQVSATGTLSAPGLGGQLGGGGGLGGQLGGGGGLGGLLGGGGGLGGLLGGGGGVPELNRAAANFVTRPPTGLTAIEGVSPRQIHLFWFPPTFGQIGSFNIYRQPAFAGGNRLSVAIGSAQLIFHSDPADPHFGQYEFVDTVTCNPSGYTYFVTAVLAGTSQESVPSNTVPGPGQPALTGCYTNAPLVSPTPPPSDLSFPNNTFVKGDLVNSINWSLQNDDTGISVTDQNSLNTLNTLSAIGPIPHDGACPQTVPQPLPSGATVIPLSTGGSGISFGAGRFSYSWNTTSYDAGCYFFKLDLDSLQSEVSASALTLLIAVGPASLPDGVAGTAYSAVFTESGGATGGATASKWTVDSGANSLPPDLALDGSTGALTGTPNMAGDYPFTVRFTDTKQNYGTRTVSLHLAIGITPTSLPDGVVGGAYSNTLFAVGATGTVTWSIASGLPPGINLDVSSGTLSGTPTAPGVYKFTAHATDHASNTGTQTVTLRVFASVCTATPSGLVSWYPLNGNALDIRGGKPGTVVGSGGQFVTAFVGKGFKSGGVGSLITVPDSLTLTPSQFSIGAWVRVDTIDNVQTMQIVWKGNQTAGDLTTPYSLSVLGSVNSNFSGGATVVGTQGPGKVLVILTDGTHELDLVSTNALPLDGKFHHVAVTADGTTVHLYIDGQLDANSASETSLSLLPFTPTNPLQIGGIQGNSAAFDGVIDELQIYSRALSGSEISAIASAGSTGQCSSLWFTEQSLNKVGRIDLTGVPVPGFPITLTTPNAMPYGVTVGPDGNVWVPEYGTGNIAVITPSGTITEDPTPLPSPNPTGLPKTGPSNITAGPDGKLWFTEYDVNQVASITTTGTVNEFPTSGTNPNAITAGPDGNIWFTELNGNMIGKITPGGALTEYPVPTASSTPSGITTGPDGNIWFTEWSMDKIGVLNPGSPSSITEYALPANTIGTNSGPQSITVGPDGNLWFTETNNDKIGKITPAGVITEYSVPPGSYPFAIVAGLDGNLWFTELHRDNIGRIAPSTGLVTEFAIDPGSLALGITVGP